MEEDTYRSWKHFTEHQYHRANTVQLCIDELADEMYYDDVVEKKDIYEEELNFDY